MSNNKSDTDSSQSQRTTDKKQNDAQVEDYGYDLCPERAEGKAKERNFYKDLKFKRQNRKCLMSVQHCAQLSPMVKILMGAMKSHGCDFDFNRHVSCEECKPPVNGGFDATANQVVICQNNTRALGRCCVALAHEMTHMFDYCRAKLDFTNLEHVACTEIRAAVFNHCSLRGAVWEGDTSVTNFKQTHQDCVKRKALMSVLMARDVSLDEGIAVIDKVFHKCYNDLEPFGRIPRVTKRKDGYCMEAEAALYGYTKK